MTDWSRFDAALARRAPVLWWRDDDAVAETQALHRLMELAGAVDAPLTLAVIPGALEDSLAPAIKGCPVTVAVHGWTHTNHAPSGQKKAEFGAHRPVDAMMIEAARGKARLDQAFSEQALPLFIPPWNRIAPELPLGDAGFRGISVYGQRGVTSEDALTRFDAHIDPIDWRGNRSAVPLQVLIGQITDLMREDAPIGLMTHHLVHDAAIWAVLEDLVTRLTKGGAQWVCPRKFLTRTAD